MAIVPPATPLNALLESMAEAKPHSLTAERREAWAAAVDAMVERARRAWPQLTLAPEVFAAYVGQRLAHDAETDLSASLEALRAEDLYLACACVGGNDAALNLFAERYTPVVDAALARLGRQGLASDDVRQQVLTYLLTGRGDTPAPLSRYAGSGDLGGYLRVAAVREGIRTLNADRPAHRAASFAFERLEAPGHDPEVMALKNRYRADFKAAFQAAIASLDDKDRRLLRYHYVDGLSTRDMGPLFGTHGSTVTRWLGRVRETVMKATRQALVAKLGLKRDEFDSVVRLVESQVDVSITRVLSE